MRLVAVLIFIFILSTLVLTVGSSYYRYIGADNILKKEVFVKLQVLAETRADYIETYLSQNIGKLNLAINIQELKTTLDKYNQNPSDELRQTMTDVILNSKNSLEEFDRICIIGLDGVVISSTDESFLGRDASGRDFFINGKSEGNVYFVQEDGVMKIFISSPIILDDKLIGVGIVVISLNELEKIVDNHVGLGKTGEVLIAVREGDDRVYIFERLFEGEAVPLINESAETAFPLKSALNKEEKLFEDTLDYRNEPVIAFSQYIETGKIGLVAKIDIKEALGEYRVELIRSAFYNMFFVVLFAFIISYFVAREVARPIKKITKDVDEISRGNVNIQLSQSGIYEIQNLIDSLNRVLVSLKLAILRTGVDKTKLGFNVENKNK